MARIAKDNWLYLGIFRRMAAMVPFEYEIFAVKTYREIKMNIKAYKEQPKTMMSTKEIAGLTGKEHFHVMRDARDMINELLQYNDHPVLDDKQYQILKDGRGYNSEILLDKELTETLITGYSVLLRHKVIRRLHELEVLVKKQAEVISQMVSIDELKEARMMLGVANAQNAHLSQRIVAEQRINEILLMDKNTDEKLDMLACEARQCWVGRSDEMEERFKYEAQCFALKEKTDALTGLIENNLGIDIKLLLEKK
ncbi:anti-repressor [Escherichia phage vB_EcoS_ESCO41]|uniref:Regulatory protein Rha n=1 Tax=Escherichia phage vB_EcoS_ESCO41 TaxID=2496547 RepID=A0A1U9WR27_9CAUD|nr:anti-repressor [Escherichia phage vB_EcoS_ESCO41]AQY55300.1 regulatory protein Rha [Escherichia phage vB_EcoS_ESCO41]